MSNRGCRRGAEAVWEPGGVAPGSAGRAGGGTTRRAGGSGTTEGGAGAGAPARPRGRGGVGCGDLHRAIRGRDRRQIPSRDDFYASFHFNVELAYVPLPSLLAEERAEVERVRAQARADAQRLDLALHLDRERAWAEEARLRAQVDAARDAATWKEQLMRQMHAEVVAQARQQKEQVVDSFLRDVVAQLRTLAYEAATDVLASLQKNGRLHSRSVVQLRNLVEHVERLNFAGDADLDAMLAGVRMQLDLAAEDRSVREVERVLRDVAVVTRSTLIGLGEQPRSARNLGVPDRPAPELVRTARGRLSLGESAQALPLPGMPQPIRRRVRVRPVPVMEAVPEV